MSNFLPQAAKDFVISSPASRGLCSNCAKYNWAYHLTRHIPNTERDALFQYEDSVVRETRNSGEAFFGLHTRKWRIVPGHDAPYSGSYNVSEDDQTWISLEYGGGISVQKPNPLGSSVNNCSVCDLVIRAARKQGLQLQSVNRVDCVFSKPMEKESMDSFVWGLELRVEGRIEPYWASMTLLGDEETAAFMRPNPHPTQIDLKILRRWWMECDYGLNHHESRPSIWSPLAHNNFATAAERFRVVDVRTARVVRQSPNSSFIALSYVWGGSSHFRLSKRDLIVPENGEKFAQLDRLALPRTIQDAMYVVESLGAQYLWVDALCIVQDDPEDLKININNMNHIYSAAQLTIIAASGPNADTGLPGIYAGTRLLDPLSSSIESIQVTENEPELDLDKTVWGTRGWTYQEYVLSHRTLIFANQRVFYECNAGIKCESRPNKVWKGAKKVRFEQFEGVFGHFRTYARHVEGYNRRTLTYDSDVLNAFSAILSEYSLQDSLKKFCWGLPLRDFTQALLWHIRNFHLTPREFQPLRRRKRDDLPSNGRLFPSWSWIGWAGDITYYTLSRAYKITQAVTWPWEPGYADNASAPIASNPFESGILSILVELASMHIGNQGNFGRDYYALFDDARLNQGSVDCFLLGSYSYADKDKAEGEYNQLRHLVLAVELHENGIYHRIGFIRTTESHWQSLERRDEYILLG